MRVKLTGILAASTVAAAFSITGATATSAAGGYTCGGGSPASPSVIPAGTYDSITVTGFCVPATGTIDVLRNFTVAPHAGFNSGDASSIVTVGGNFDVQKGGLVALGCGPSFDTPCPEGANVTSSDAIGGNLSAEQATLLIFHYDTIGRNVDVQSGGGGLTCAPLPGLGGTPPYVDVSNNSIGGNAAVSGLRTCWAGFANNGIGGNVSYDDSKTVIPDGNFVGGNTIGRNLSCEGNSPNPHLSDGAPVPNSVAGHTSGQCVGEV